MFLHLHFWHHPNVFPSCPDWNCSESIPCTIRHRYGKRKKERKEAILIILAACQVATILMWFPLSLAGKIAGALAFLNHTAIPPEQSLFFIPVQSLRFTDSTAGQLKLSKVVKILMQPILDQISHLTSASEKLTCPWILWWSGCNADLTG